MMEGETANRSQLGCDLMAELVLQCPGCTTECCCALCGTALGDTNGATLTLAENNQPVCPPCGKRHAPALTALLSLASVADRVTKIGQHSVVPPMSALLDLARAAENYSFQRSETQRGG